MTTLKPMVIKEEVYNQLEPMKTKTNRSFSDVIEDILKNNKIQQEDIQNLIKERNELRLKVAELNNDLEKYKINM